MFPTKVASVTMKALIVLFFVSAVGLLFLGTGGIKNSYSLISVVIPSPEPPSPDDPIGNSTLGVGGSAPGILQRGIVDGINSFRKWQSSP